ncbi:MAG: hypothetical protein ACI8PZ_003439 [Myxococcota bacterium]|jgi:hypothetical protein
MHWMMLVLASVASAGELDDRLLAAHGSATWSETRAALVEDASIDDATLAQVAVGDEWRAALSASAVLAWRADADQAAATWSAATRESRAGTPVFDARVGTATPAVLAERLVHAGEPVAIRRALIDQLRRTDAVWGPWVAGLLLTDADPGVRAMCAETLRYAEGDATVRALRSALTDPDAEVRAAAARGAGWSKVGPQLVDALVAATADADHGVAGFAARSLGWLEAESAFDAVVRVIEGADPRARLDALRALERIDAARAATHPAVQQAVSDPDEKVARAASQITGG